ncbi:hypothetical protein QJS04_geneDACA009590 [Acorus gramineus]|uniref:Uncharacterized protein n=1 Tax=Acorus gramineus TaxID=55184 RepID=A0AAV9B9A3_ACOGR|nr:hypothetical protein QJS04_geneDACA009590 [Acorus gramineus]
MKCPIWDCESSLYEAFELDSSSTRLTLPLQQLSSKQQHRLHSMSKLSRSLNRLVRMVFWLKPTPGGATLFLFEQHHERGYDL